MVNSLVGPIVEPEAVEVSSDGEAGPVLLCVTANSAGRGAATGDVRGGTAGAAWGLGTAVGGTAVGGVATTVTVAREGCWGQSQSWLRWIQPG